MKKNTKTYDKASWHIDGGEDSTDVINRFKELFSFLDEKGMLNDDGKEILEFGIDSSVSLNNTLVTDYGEQFLDQCYDTVLSQYTGKMRYSLEIAYRAYFAQQS